MADEVKTTGAAVAEAEAALEKARAADAAAQKEAAANRGAGELIRDLLAQIVEVLGNRPAMEQDLKLLQATFKPKE